MAKLLVIDDEPSIVFSIETCLATPALDILSAGTARAGLELIRRERPDAVLLDVRLPDISGLEAFEEIRKRDPLLPVVIMTAYSKSETAMEAMSRGAFDYLTKPVDLNQLKTVVSRALETSRLNRIPAVVADDDERTPQEDRIVGQSPTMQEVYKAIGRMAPQEAPILILGESGTGKELVARAIYHYSRRRDRPFLAINCAALPEMLLESELFGHERGAFTGADQRRIGKFEQVNGGTIFLDEVGDMSAATQAKALRLLQEQQFERLGGNSIVKTDVRIIAATNQDLQQRVSENRFRLDLFYRLNGLTIHLPPLRERVSDIPELAGHFLRKFHHSSGRSVVAISNEAMQALQRHSWPGNVRELRSVIQFAVLHAPGDIVTLECLPPSCAGQNQNFVGAAPPSSGFELTSRTQAMLADGAGDVYRRILNEVDAVVLRLAWEQTDGNQVQAAELLGVSRMTLRGKLRALGLVPEPSSDDAG